MATRYLYLYLSMYLYGQQPAWPPGIFIYICICPCICMVSNLHWFSGSWWYFHYRHYSSLSNSLSSPLLPFKVFAKHLSNMTGWNLVSVVCYVFHPRILGSNFGGFVKYRTFWQEANMSEISKINSAPASFQNGIWKQIKLNKEWKWVWVRKEIQI